LSHIHNWTDPALPGGERMFMMKSRGAARVGLLASGLVVSAIMVLTPDIASSEALATSTFASGTIDNGGSTAGAGGDHVQRLGCEKASKPTCNKPGRRSTRR
jgi:hypothetical protein